MASESNSDKLNCSFCGKVQDDVKKLIAGPNVYICNECVDLCNDIIEEEIKNDEDRPLEELPSPSEIFAKLDEYVIGQDKAKKVLSAKVYILIIYRKVISDDDDDMPSKGLKNQLLILRFLISMKSRLQ